MHFWINKGSNGRGLNGRYAPTLISGAGTRRPLFCGGLHPKPMVTPVHRFQSIESVASGRHTRAPPYQHNRFPGPPASGHHHHHNHHHHHHNNGSLAEIGGSTSGGRQYGNQRTRRSSLEYVTNGEHNTLTPADGGAAPTAKVKCGVWAIIGLIPFLIVGAKYYFNGENMGMEALTFCAILILILLVGGVVSLFEAFGTKRTRRPSVQLSSEQNETFEDSSQNPGAATAGVTPIHSELPPPPYHVAVMLPTHDRRLVQDSPPPTYEKAVT